MNEQIDVFRAFPQISSTLLDVKMDATMIQEKHDFILILKQITHGNVLRIFRRFTDSKIALRFCCIGPVSIEGTTTRSCEG